VRKVFGRRFYNSDEAQDPRNPEKNIQVITPVYNSAAYIKNCILSVAQQDYNNYNMHIINDKSTDNTLDVINKTLASLPENIRGKFNVINNETNMGAVYNQINTIRSKVKIASIVMLLDGDDWLVNDPNIFHKYNNIYKDGKAEFTYGSCYSLVDKIPLIAQPYPPEIKKNKEYRKYKFNWNMPYTHLRTFDARLLNNINDSVFKDAEGNWLKAGGDTSVFYNLIEQADPGNVICVPDIVYNYNDINPLNDYKVNAREQTKNANMVMEKTP
jgi:glycosyltransferase involved in cell wall biosynthesis